MRVRVFEMRLLAAGLTFLWGLACLLVLVGYRPGGPADLLVGVAFLVPVALAASGLVWPAAAQGPLTYRMIVILAMGTGLILVPSIGGIWTQLVDRGLQTLLPSFEAAYPWALAVLGTSLFAGLGLSRRLLGGDAARPRRLASALAIGLAAAAVTGTLLASVSVANDLALAGRAAGSSRFGPTDPTLEPPACDQGIAVGQTAVLEGTLGGVVDGRSLGGARIVGARSGNQFRWTSQVASSFALGLGGAISVGARGWLREPGQPWTTTSAAAVAGESLDLAVVMKAIDPLARSAIEEVGLAYVEGARARHCRAQLDGTVFRAAFPQVRWLAGTADLAKWRGQIDYWVFSDGQLGQASAWIEGEGFALVPGAIHGRLEAALIATDRGSAITIAPRGG